MQGRWWRTFLIQLPVVLFGILLIVVGGAVASRVNSILVDVAMSAVALGVSAPLVALVETALFEEYSGQGAPSAVEEGQEE